MATIKTKTGGVSMENAMRAVMRELENTPLTPEQMTAAIARLKRSAAHYPPTSADLIQVLAQYERDVAELQLRLSVPPPRGDGWFAKTMELNPNGCTCKICNPNWGGMFLCRLCGCKRCPKARDHRNGCGNSNLSGQIGSFDGITYP